jgi:hypothetical protein
MVNGANESPDMKQFLAATALAVAMGFSGQALAATVIGAAPSAATSITVPGAAKTPTVVANRGGGSGNDVWPNQRPSYLS